MFLGKWLIAFMVALAGASAAFSQTCTGGPCNASGFSMGSATTYQNTINGPTGWDLMASGNTVGILNTTSFELHKPLNIVGSGNGIVFADGTTQTTATLTGPAGPQGPAGPAGPQGPPGPQLATTFSAHCAGPFLPGDNVVLNPLGQTNAQYCSNFYRGITVLYQAEFGNGGQSGNFSIYTDAPSNTKVDTQYGFAASRAGTLSNLRVSAITVEVLQPAARSWCVRSTLTTLWITMTSSSLALSEPPPLAVTPPTLYRSTQGRES